MERIMEEEQEAPTLDNPAVTDLRERIGLKRLDITLDHPQRVYYGGKCITGKIYLELQAPTTGLGIRMKCKGGAHVHFTYGTAGFRRKFSAEETYLQEEIYLEGDGNSEVEIKDGVYPFSLKLPENAVCSFEGRYGRVRYSVRAILDVTKIDRFSTDAVAFTVAPVFDLNLDPLAPLPISESLSKTLMGQSEPLSMSIFLPVRGYVPGQNIPLKITLNNTSSVDVKKLRIVLKKVVLYNSMMKVRKHKEIVVEIEQQVEKNCDEYEADMVVPAIPPTGTVCDLISVRYTLKVEAFVNVGEWYYRMFHKNLKIRTCLVVGTVPLKNYEDPMELSNDSHSDASPENSQARAREKDNDKPNAKKSGKDYAPAASVEPTLRYQRSRIYRSSKPDRDDPTGDEGDSDGEVEPYSPMYRVYKFEASREKGVST